MRQSGSLTVTTNVSIIRLCAIPAVLTKPLFASVANREPICWLAFGAELASTFVALLHSVCASAIDACAHVGSFRVVVETTLSDLVCQRTCYHPCLG